jgi:hypothetical protein
MPDAELTAALKQAKSKKMFFAFIPKGGSDGQLIVSKAKIPAKPIADAKKEIGGGNAVTGKCFGGDGGAMLFQVAKPASPALAAAVKKVAKRDTGLTIDPDFQLAGDADADEKDLSAAAAGGAPAPVETAPEALVSLNLGPWQAARQNTINDLKALAAKVAGTKQGAATGVLKEINSIITKLPAKPAANELDKLEDFIRNDDTITAAERIPANFHDLDIREPLLPALAAMKK